MSGFVFAAIVMAMIAMLVIVLPLIARERRVEGEPTGAAPVAAVISTATLVIGAAGLYVAWSNWNAPAATATATPAAPGAAPADPHAAPGAPDEMVGKLARRLERDPDDLQGWLLLGRSYVVQGQYPLAVRAYQRADRLAGGKNAEALSGWAEALILENEEEIEGRAGRLFEMALAIEPDAPKALFFGAVGAQRRGELPQARQRFARLLELGAPDDIRGAIEQQIAALDAQIGGAAAGGGAPRTADAKSVQPDAATGSTTAPGPAANSAARSGAAGDSSGSAAAGEPVIRLRVVLGDSTRAAAGEARALFVSARRPGQPGPPLAVRRLETALPQAVELRQSDSMVEGLSFAAGETVEVVARLSRSGNANAAAGDPVGRLRYDVGKDGVRELRIDSLTP